MFIINSIAPIFLLIALGRLLQQVGFFPAGFFKGINRLVFWLALPALLISNISAAQIDFDAISKIILLFAAGTLASLGIAKWVAVRLRLPAPKTGSFIQGSFRGNGAFVGLPIIIYTLGTLDPRAEMLGTVTLAAVVIIFNILSVGVLLHYSQRKRSREESVAALLGQLVKNPLIMSCALGIALNLSGIQLPLLLFRPLDALGHAALPLILMSIGASLEFERLRDSASPTLIAALLKVAVTPALGFLLAPLLPLDASEKMIAILYLACPTAGMSYIMADVMGTDAPLAGRIVALSTVLSAITLPIIIAIGL